MFVTHYIPCFCYCVQLKTWLNLYIIVYSLQNERFLARGSIICRALCMLLPARISVPLSVTWVDQSKTIEVRIMQLSPQNSQIPLVFVI